MRHKLSGYRANACSVWYGTFVSFGKDKNSQRPVALIKDITNKDGEYITDHLWVHWDRLPKYSWMVECAEFKFNAVVVPYRKLDEKTNRFVDDFTLGSVANCKRLSS